MLGSNPRLLPRTSAGGLSCLSMTVFKPCEAWKKYLYIPNSRLGLSTIICVSLNHMTPLVDCWKLIQVSIISKLTVHLSTSKRSQSSSRQFPITPLSCFSHYGGCRTECVQSAGKCRQSGESSVGCWLLLFYRSSEGKEVNGTFCWHSHGKPKLNWGCDFTLQKYPSPPKWSKF